MCIRDSATRFVVAGDQPGVGSERQIQLRHGVRRPRVRQCRYWIDVDPSQRKQRRLRHERDPREIKILSLHVRERTTAYPRSVSYTHLRAHETVLDLVCRLLL